MRSWLHASAPAGSTIFGRRVPHVTSRVVRRLSNRIGEVALIRRAMSDASSGHGPSTSGTAERNTHCNRQIPTSRNSRPAAVPISQMRARNELSFPPSAGARRDADAGAAVFSRRNSDDTAGTLAAAGIPACLVSAGTAGLRHSGAACSRSGIAAAHASAIASTQWRVAADCRRSTPHATRPAPMTSESFIRRLLSALWLRAPRCGRARPPTAAPLRRRAPPRRPVPRSRRRRYRRGGGAPTCAPCGAARRADR